MAYLSGHRVILFVYAEDIVGFISLDREAA